MEEKREYWAFISYRHLDNKEAGREWATWIAREIETYDVPPDLVGTAGSRGDTIPERIYPVFRDEDELSADADLSSPIYEALRNSKTVVVICSPRAVSSRYVDNEITYFKSLGGGDRVLAMMIEGEPHSPDERECFPEALKHSVDEEGKIDPGSQVEPVAADFRLPDGSQGWHSPAEYRKHRPDDRAAEKYRERCDLAKLKLIAGILGLPLGKLIERDKAYQLALAKRKARIFTAVAAAMGVLAVLAVVGGIIAANERDRAQRSEKLEIHARGTAENLITQMLFDLGEKLENINQVELLDDVSRTAEEYFVNLPPGQVDEKSERNRSVTLHSRAGIQEATGDLEGAHATLERALQLSQSLSEANPESFLAARDTIITYREIGDLYVRQGEPGKAAEYYQKSAEKLIPTLSEVYDDSGELLAALFSPDGDGRSTELLTRAAKSEFAAGILKEMSALMERVGNLAVAEGDLERAAGKYNVSLQINEALSMVNPGNDSLKKNCHASYDKLGIIEQKLGNFGEAEKHFQRIADLTRAELAKDPGNALWQQNLARALERLAGNNVLLDRHDRAFDFATEALAYRRSLVANDPVNLGLQQGLNVALVQASLAADGLNRKREAELYRAEAAKIADRLVEIDPSNAEWRALAETIPGSSEAAPLKPSDVGEGIPKAEVDRISEQ